MFAAIALVVIGCKRVPLSRPIHPEPSAPPVTPVASEPTSGSAAHARDIAIVGGATYLLQDDGTVRSVGPDPAPAAARLEHVRAIFGSHELVAIFDDGRATFVAEGQYSHRIGSGLVEAYSVRYSYGAVARTADNHWRFESGEPQRRFEVIPDAISLGVGRAHVCIAASDGRVACDGSEIDDGQLGYVPERYGAGRSPYAPPRIVPIELVVELASHPAASQTCARTQGGAIVCWGSRGTGTREDPHVLLGEGPVTLPPIANATGIAIGPSEVYVRTADGHVARYSPEGRAYGAPQLLEGLTEVRKVVCGGVHSCALRESGEVWCWGASPRGELGPVSREYRGTPQPLVVQGAS